MRDSETTFAQLLRNGIYAIKFRESGSVEAIQDSLGREIGRKDGQLIEQWRNGVVLPNVLDLERVAAAIMRRSSLDKLWLQHFIKKGQHPDPEVATERLLRAMQEEKSGIRANEAQQSNTNLTSKPASAASEPLLTQRQAAVPMPREQRRPAFVVLLGIAVIVVLAFIFLPQQLNSSRPNVDRPNAVQADGVHDVIAQVGVPQWRESCATTANNGVVIVQRSSGQSQACINREITVAVDDFSAEWRFVINDGTALFLAGQNAQHYRAALNKEDREIVISIVEKDGAVITELRHWPIVLLEDQTNLLSIVRDDAEIRFALNNEPILATEDALYAGERTELWLGVGGAASADGAATITYESIILTEH